MGPGLATGAFLVRRTDAGRGGTATARGPGQEEKSIRPKPLLW
jgi:hypothetical protein